MKALQNDIKDYLMERGWENLPLEDLAKSISIEASELLEHFQWSNFHKDKSTDLESVKEELADVVTYCFDMAVAMNIDLEDVVRKKLDKVKIKYPAIKIVENNDEYYKIKNKHRE